MLEQHLKDRGYSLYKAALHAGIDPNNLREAVRGPRNLSDKMIESLAEKQEFDLTVEQIRLWKAMDEYPELADGTQLKAPIELTIKGTVAAGALCMAEETDLGTIEWYDTDGHYADGCFPLIVSGDSMWPPVPNGAVIIVKPANELRSGNWYVIQTTDGDSTFKVVVKHRNTIRLQPLSPDHNELEVPPKNIEKLYEVIQCVFSPKIVK